MAVVSPVPADDKAPRTVTVLGSTGSVGCNTIDLIRRSPDRFRVDTLSGNSNVTLLAQQAVEVGANMAVVADGRLYNDLKSALSGSGIEVAAGRNALIEAAMRPTDWVMAAIVGAAGDLDSPLTSQQKGFRALVHHLTGTTTEMRPTEMPERKRVKKSQLTSPDGVAAISTPDATPTTAAPMIAFLRPKNPAATPEMGGSEPVAQPRRKTSTKGGVAWCGSRSGKASWKVVDAESPVASPIA